MNDYKNKKYVTLLFDALQLHSIAKKFSEEQAKVLYRSAIVASVVSLECVANICIDSLGLPEEIYNQIEKFSTLSKFEYYAYVRRGVSIDKSRNEYSLLKALVSIRNDYVHPKVEGGKVTDDGQFICYGNKKAFNFSNDVRLWGKRESELVINSKILFLNYYFCELCGYDAGLTTALIGCQEEFPNKLIKMYIGVGDQFELLGHLGVKIMYLDLRQS